MLSEIKIEKYSSVINAWLICPTHTLKHIQELYSKLLHTASIVPQVHAYLIGLESMLSTCAKRPFLPHRLDKDIQEDLLWWRHRILTCTIIQPISSPSTPLDLHTFSDASSGLGISIIIRTRWRAW